MNKSRKERIFVKKAKVLITERSFSQKILCSCLSRGVPCRLITPVTEGQDTHVALRKTSFPPANNEPNFEQDKAVGAAHRIPEAFEDAKGSDITDKSQKQAFRGYKYNCTS